MPIDKHSAQFITNTVTQPTQSSAPGIWRLEDVNNSVAANRWPLAPNLLRRSLRFNRADSTVLTRTPTVAGNRRTWTWSGWFKTAGLLNANYHLFDTQPSATYTGAYINSTGALEFRDWQSGSFVWLLTTSTLYRDPSAWYHVVFVHDTTQATASDRAKIYVNGVQVTQFSTATYPSLNYQSNYNNTVVQYIGGFDGTTNGGFTGFITEINSIDGQALTPSSFGETDPQTGVWVPKLYTGTYGTNGFRLNFSNNSSTTALGYDSSGQGNNFTANNFSIASGTDNDSLLDTPSMYGVDTGLGGEVGGTYCTINSLMQNTSVATLSNGNLQGTTGTSGVSSAYIGTIGFNSGKWYFEVHVGAIGTNNMWIGISKNQAHRTVDAYINTWTYNKLGQKTDNAATGSSYGAAYTTGDIIGVAVDADTGSITFYKNGISQGVAFTGLSMSGGVYAIAGSDNSATIIFNFGQRPFASPAPAGYKCLTTQNLSTPLGNVAATQANKYFDVVTYTGNGSTQTISGLGFQPDLVWIKNRDSSTVGHRLIDSVRGATKEIYSHSTVIEAIDTQGLTSFTSDGFTVGNSTSANTNTNRHVAWCWKAGGTPVSNTQGSITSSVSANQAAGFSIVTWTYTGAATIGHGLNAVPKFMIIRGRNAVYNWDVYHASLGPTVRLMLNSTSSTQTVSGPFNNTNPTSTVFSQGAAWYNNGDLLVGYIFAEVPGYSAFGSYTGNGSADGPFVYTGFRPKLIILKSSTVTDTNWQINDTARDIYNVVNKRLAPSAADAEATNYDFGDILSNGFKIRQTDQTWNSSGGTYIYAAFAETPFKNTRAR